MPKEHVTRKPFKFLLEVDALFNEQLSKVSFINYIAVWVENNEKSLINWSSLKFKMLRAGKSIKLLWMV